jgi:hypothetical protein
MKTNLNKTNFGSTTIHSKKYDHDILIGLSGNLTKRKKNLSKQEIGTLHILSLSEAKVQ